MSTGVPGSVARPGGIQCSGGIRPREANSGTDCSKREDAKGRDVARQLVGACQMSFCLGLAALQRGHASSNKAGVDVNDHAGN